MCKIAIDQLVSETELTRQIGTVMPEYGLFDGNILCLQMSNKDNKFNKGL